MFAATGSLGTAKAFSDGVSAAIGVSAALSLMGAVAGMALPRQRAVALALADAKA